MNESAAASPREAMLGLLSGYWFSATLHAAAALGIADLVARGPRTSMDIANATGADEDALRRLLSALASAGIFTETAPGTFAQSPLSETLRDVSGSLRSLAVLGGDALHWAAWGRLLDGVRSGATPFRLAHGAPFFDVLERSRAVARCHGEAWSALGDVDAAICDAYDFSRSHAIVDVGGGHGGLLCQVRAAAPRARCVLLDLPSVLAAAPPLGGVETISGDFFDAVPAGGDLYVLKFVLHDWPDDRAASIVANCARAMVDGGRLLIIELLAPTDTSRSYARIDDLNMFVLTGGRARTEEEFRGLLGGAGLALDRIVTTAVGVSVLEAAEVVAPRGAES